MKERKPTTRDNLEVAARVATGVALAVSGLIALKQDKVDGITPTVTDYSHLDFKPVVIDNGVNKDSINIPDRRTVVFPHSHVIFTPEPSLSPEKQKIQDLQTEATRYVQIAQESGKFSVKEIADIKMYYPIYKAVGDKFHIDWYLIWINHEGETGASNSKKAFNGESYPYFGGWQRNVNMWPKSFVDKAFKGLEFLQSIKTRNKTDGPEAAAMAAQAIPNMEKYMHLGPYQAVLKTEMIFTGDKTGKGISLTRANFWQECSKIFKSVLIPQS